MHELTPEDRYHLLKSQMDADKKMLESRKAQQDLERVLLDLEYKYGLISEGGTIDPRSGSVITENNNSARKNGKDTNVSIEDTVPLASS